VVELVLGLGFGEVFGVADEVGFGVARVGVGVAVGSCVASVAAVALGVRVWVGLAGAGLAGVAGELRLGRVVTTGVGVARVSVVERAVAASFGTDAATPSSLTLSTGPHATSPPISPAATATADTRCRMLMTIGPP